MSDETCCYKCKTVEKPLVQIKLDENKDDWICMKHLFMQILDVGMKEMHNNMSSYSQVLFNYKDEFQK